MHFYRYQPINKQSLINLSQQKNWVADPLEFNDPFEFHLKGDHLFDKEEREKINFVERFDNREKIKEKIAKFGVVCYSTHDDSKLMWSHYADCHKGLCLVFDVPKEIVKDVFLKIDYSLKVPDCFFNADDVDNWQDFLKIVKTKSVDWEYEGEYRQVFLEKNIFADYPGKLIEVIFGCQTKRHDIDLVINILKSFFEEITISKMYLSESSFILGKSSMTLKKGKKYWIPDIWDGKGKH